MEGELSETPLLKMQSSEASEDTHSTADEILAQTSISETFGEMKLDGNANPPRDTALFGRTDLKGATTVLENISPCKEETVVDAISSKLNEIHTVAKLIKALLFKCKSENTEVELIAHGEKSQDTSSPVNISVCPCGETDCIEICCIRECLLKSKIDRDLLLKFLRMALLYLDLAEAYIANFQSDKALNSIRLACCLFASLHANADEGLFISYKEFNSSDQEKVKKSTNLFNYYRFWAKAWSLVAEVYTGLCETTVPVAVLHKENASSSKVSASYKEVKTIESGRLKKYCRKGSLEMPSVIPNTPILSKSLAPDSLNSKIASIFKYLEDALPGDPEDVLTCAISFFYEAKKVLQRFPNSSMALQRFAYWKANAYSILGKSKLNNRDRKCAELAFLDAKEACKEAGNLVGVAMNTFWLGQCKRGDIEHLESCLEHSSKQGHVSEMKILELLGGSKSDYIQYLRYLTDALSEIDAIKSPDPEKNKVKAIILKDLGMTYMNLATVLVRTRTDLEVSGREMKKLFINANPPGEKGIKRGVKKHKISAGDVILEGAKIFESMGEWAKYHVAEGYRQRAMHLRCCCNDLSKKSLSGNKVKQQTYLVKEKMEKSMHLPDPQEYPSEYLKILMEQVAFSSSLPSSLLSNLSDQESFLSLLLEGHKVVGAVNRNTETESKFLSELQSLLKNMLKSNDEKLKTLYLMSLKPDGDSMSQLQNMYEIWKA